MRPWQIILASVIAATAVAAAVAAPTMLALGAHAPSATIAALRPMAPFLASAWLGAYGLCAVVLATATLFIALRASGRRVERQAAALARDPAELARVLPPALHRIAAGLPGIVFGPEAEPSAIRVVRHIGVPSRIRRTCRSLHFCLLARVQYPTALLLLLALAIVGPPSAMPAALAGLPEALRTMPELLALLVLVVAGVVGHAVLDAAIEPFAAACALLPVENTETRLLRQLLELARSQAERPGPSSRFDEDRVRSAVEASQRPVLDAITRLTAALEGFGRLMRSGLDEVKDGLQGIDRAARLDEDAAELSAYREISGEIRSTLAALNHSTAALDELSSSLANASDQRLPAPGDIKLAADGDPSRLSRELRALLREIGTEAP